MYNLYDMSHSGHLNREPCTMNHSTYASMNSYQKEQAESISMVRHRLSSLSPPEIQLLREQMTDYLSFRDAVRGFLSGNFGEACSQKCYQSKLSACCSREGIITFFADVVINVLLSSDADMEELLAVLQKPNNGFKCIYLGPQGCLWKLKPIVCEMFLCDQAQEEVFKENPDARNQWEELKKQEKTYRWPDRPVLFDEIERYFIDAGYSSSLMYLHNSPGLLRVKEQAKRS